jgi:hypothetical protein
MDLNSKLRLIKNIFKVIFKSKLSLVTIEIVIRYFKTIKKNLVFLNLKVL